MSDEWTDAGELLDLLATGRPWWWWSGACRHAPPGVTWFPTVGEPVGPALEVCAVCPVLADCRSWALAQGPILHGIWGGLTRRGRRELAARL